MTKSETKQIEIRPLNGDDIFPVITILDKTGLLDQLESLMKDMQEETQKIEAAIISDLVKSGKKKEDITADDLANDPRSDMLNNDIIFKLVKKVIVKLPLARKEINQFIADLTGLSYTEVKVLGIKQYTRVIFDFFKQPDLAELLESIMG